MQIAEIITVETVVLFKEIRHPIFFLPDLDERTAASMEPGNPFHVALDAS